MDAPSPGGPSPTEPGAEAEVDLAPTDPEPDLSPEALAEEFHLLPHEAQGLAAWRGAWLLRAAHQPQESTLPEPGADVLAFLTLMHEPWIAEAALVHALAQTPTRSRDFAAFVASLAQVAPRRALAHLTWIQAHALEMCQEIAEAERLLHEAEALDSDCFLAVHDLATYATVRGDAERALSLLRRANVSRLDPRVQVNERFLPAKRPDLGRNDRCWCGSGRKYKACHLGDTSASLPLEERAAWLYQKAVLHVLDERWNQYRYTLSTLLAGAEASEAELEEAMNSSLIIDLTLFEADGLTEFVTYRGALLPPDELALLQQWQTVPRSLHRVLDVTPGVGFHVRDLRTDAEFFVHSSDVSRRLSVDMVLYSRFLPAGEEVRGFSGYEPVDEADVATILERLDEQEPDITALLQLFGDARAGLL